MDAALLENDAAPRAFSSGGATSTVTEDFEDDNGPPSSINVARALASLRADELKRVEELVSADEEEEAKRADADAPAPASPAPEPAASPPPPTVLIGKTIALPKLAEQMRIPPKDLTSQLVASGFYSVHGKTVFSRETARTVAQMFGWQVEEAPDEEAPAPPPPKKKAKAGAKKKSAAKKKR